MAVHLCKKKNAKNKGNLWRTCFRSMRWSIAPSRWGSWNACGSQTCNAVPTLEVDLGHLGQFKFISDCTCVNMCGSGLDLFKLEHISFSPWGGGNFGGKRCRGGWSNSSRLCANPPRWLMGWCSLCARMGCEVWPLSPLNSMQFYAILGFNMWDAHFPQHAKSMELLDTLKFSLGVKSQV